jgi:hypothetical protein
MKKTTIAMAVSALFALTVGVAQAEVCYKLNPFVDILRLNTVTNDSSTVGAVHKLTHGNWISGAYTLPVVGAIEFKDGSTTVRRLGIHGTNNTTAFGNNPICALDGIPGQPWFLVCTAGPGVRFTNNGSALTSIPCNGLAPSLSTDGGAAAGD